MSLKENMLDELKRSPIATITGISGAVLATMALLIAWSQYQGSAPQVITLSTEGSPTQSGIYLGNLLLIIGYFVALTISTAFLFVHLQENMTLLHSYSQSP